MLFSPVYIKSHPRRDAAHSDSPIFLESFNSCTFNSFGTLVAQWSAATLVFSDASGLFPLQWGCTPLAQSSCTAPSPICSISRRPSHFPSRAYKMLLAQLLCFDNHPFSWEVYTPSQTEYVTTRTPSTHALCLGASVAIPLMMYPVPGFSAGSDLPARKRHSGIFLREAQ
jgi:hypothetical protein